MEEGEYNAECEFEALLNEFRALPGLPRDVVALRYAMQRAAQAGDQLAQECYDADARKMLGNLRDLFLFRMAFPERPKSESRHPGPVADAEPPAV